MKTEKIVLESKHLKLIAIFVVPLVIYITLVCIGLVGEGSQQFALLANSFDHGHTYFLHSIGGVGQDPVYYHGKIYWDEGPFPAVVLMPFVALFNIWHATFYQGYVKWIFVLAISFFVYALARRQKYSKVDALTWMFGFTLGSVFIGIGSVSSGWLYAQVVATFLAVWALYEYSKSRRWWLIGIIVGCLFLTRIPAAALIVFFLLAIIMAKEKWGIKGRRLVQLLVPMLLAIILMGAYNYQRFGSPLNGGNEYQLVSLSTGEARSIGLFSIKHIPTNLYTALLRAPVPVLRNPSSWSLKFPYVDNNSLGVSIFITSPYLLYFFLKRWSSYPKEAKYLIIASLASALLVLTYFGDGADQLGYRYSMDFMPALFLALMMIYRKNNSKLSTGMTILLLGSGITNFYLLTTYVR